MENSVSNSSSHSSRPDSVYTLDVDTCSMILDLVKDIDYQQTDTSQNDEALRLIFERRDAVPQAVRHRLLDFKFSHTSFLRINGLPQEKHPEVLLLISGLLGMPFCHAQESSLVSVVKPKKEAREEEISYYTWNKFALHSELPYVKNPPDFLVLHCKYNVPNGFTHTASVDEAVALLDEQDIAMLLQPFYQIVIPPHFNHHEPYAPNRPIIERFGNHYRIRIRFDDIRYLSEGCQGAVERLYAALDQVQIKHLLGSGDMLIINNNASLHGRSSFQPNFGDRDRELYRVYLYSDCAKILNNLDYNNKRISGF